MSPRLSWSASSEIVLARVQTFLTGVAVCIVSLFFWPRSPRGIYNRLLLFLHGCLLKSSFVASRIRAHSDCDFNDALDVSAQRIVFWGWSYWVSCPSALYWDERALNTGVGIGHLQPGQFLALTSEGGGITGWWWSTRRGCEIPPRGSIRSRKEIKKIKRKKKEGK